MIMARKKSIKKRTKKKIEVNEEPAERKECPECGSNNVVYSKISDNTICRDCGAIFAKLIPKEEEFEKAKKRK